MIYNLSFQTIWLKWNVAAIDVCMWEGEGMILILVILMMMMIVFVIVHK